MTKKNTTKRNTDTCEGKEDRSSCSAVAFPESTDITVENEDIEEEPIKIDEITKVLRVRALFTRENDKLTSNFSVERKRSIPCISLRVSGRAYSIGWARRKEAAKLLSERGGRGGRILSLPGLSWNVCIL